MIALVATPRSLLLVDCDRRTVVPVESHRPEYYGITWQPGLQELVLSHTGIDSESLVDLAAYAQSEVGTISLGDAASHPFLSAPHQILRGDDGRIICTNTGRNCVTILDPERPGHFQEARVGDARWDRLSSADRGGLHLNSLFLSGGLLFVLAHGFERGSRLATFRYPSMELVSLEPLPGLTGLHNYCITGRGERISCHSNAGTLVDPHTGMVHWRSGTAGYLRGLSVADAVVLVGDSPKSGRSLRAAAAAGLWVVDRATWTARDYIPLGPYGVVNEVRLLDLPDEAHHGRPFEGLTRLMERDERRETAAMKLDASRRAREAHARLPFERIIGSPEIDDAGRWHSTGDLCLLLARGAAPQRIAMDYDLAKAASTEHCSLVIGYAGPAAKDAAGGESVRTGFEAELDSRMDVLLVNRGSHGALPALSRWTHDGTDWRCEATLLSDMPVSARLSASLAGAEMTIAVDGREVLRLPVDLFSRVESPWGFRWQGTAILPQSP